MQTTVLAALLISLPLIAIGASVAPPAPAPHNQPAAPLSAEDRSRIDRLEDQIALVRDYNDDFLSVVLWALGTVGAITIVLIGFNWFQSSRALKRELDAFKAELAGSVANSTADLSRRIEAQLAELQKKVHTMATEVADERIGKVRGQIGWLRSEILELQYKMIEAEVADWQRRNVVINAVNTCEGLIRCFIQLNQDWRISNAIDLLNESLDLLKKGTRRLDARELSELEAAVEQLPDTHKSARAAVLQRLTELHRGK